MKNYPTIVYCATRQPYIDEAEISARSIRKWYDDKIEIVLYVSDLAYTNNLFDEIYQITHPRLGYADKVLAKVKTDREKILFLDSDTYVIEPIDELFDLLPRFEMALAHAPNRWRVDLKEVPRAFPELNCGVILLQKTDRVKRLLQEWYDLYLSIIESGCEADSGDQVPLRKLLYESDIRLATLTPEYNCRFNYGSMVSHTVKILHGRSKNLELVAQKINDYPLNSIGERGVRWIKYGEDE